MSTVEEYGARLRAIGDDLPMAQLLYAADRLENAAALLAQSLDGSARRDGLAALRAAGERLTATLTMLGATRESMETYLAAIGLPGPSGASAAATEEATQAAKRRQAQEERNRQRDTAAREAAERDATARERQRHAGRNSAERERQRLVADAEQARLAARQTARQRQQDAATSTRQREAVGERKREVVERRAHAAPQVSRTHAAAPAGRSASVPAPGRSATGTSGTGSPPAGTGPLHDWWQSRVHALTGASERAQPSGAGG